MRRHGIAIAVVLMISALLLVCAFGIAAMGTMPLNLARANLASVQQDFTAQAALEQVRYELLVAEQQQRVQQRRAGQSVARHRSLPAGDPRHRSACPLRQATGL